MTKKAYFRLKMRGESDASYASEKRLWAESMRRNGYDPQ